MLDRMASTNWTRQNCASASVVLSPVGVHVRRLLLVAAAIVAPAITKERAMHNGPKRIMSTRQPRTAVSFAVRSKPETSSAVRSEPKHPQNAQRNYERYLALARVEDLIGNTVGAENYYQHAEHYFRLMTSAR
jgi:hypothetical protein